MNYNVLMGALNPILTHSPISKKVLYKCQIWTPGKGNGTVCCIAALIILHDAKNTSETHIGTKEVG